MDEEIDPTHPLRVDAGEEGPRGADRAAATDDRPLDRAKDPVEAFREPERRIWLLLGIALLSLLNLILLIALLATVTDDLQDQVVEVEGQRCLVVEEDDANVLYCQR
jgi:hypothetical protein